MEAIKAKKDWWRRVLREMGIRDEELLSMAD